MIFRKIEAEDVPESSNVRIAARENTMSLESLAGVEITPGYSKGYVVMRSSANQTRGN